MIIPVWLSCVKVKSLEILVYVWLDTQSSSTFAAQDVYKKINADSEPVGLNLMTNRSSIVSSWHVSSLKVRGYSSKEIELPTAYTQ